MSGAANPPPAVTIDRLVLDIPGFDPANAGALAEGIAAALASGGMTGRHLAAPVTVSLEAAALPLDALAAHIAAALRERLA